jgi:hypothetical protein
LKTCLKATQVLMILLMVILTTIIINMFKKHIYFQLDIAITTSIRLLLGISLLLLLKNRLLNLARYFTKRHREEDIRILLK